MHRLHVKYVKALYRSVLKWFDMTDTAIRYGINQQLLLGNSNRLHIPDSGAWAILKADYTEVDVVPWLADWDAIDREGTKRFIGPHQVRIFGKAMGIAAELAKIKTPWNVVNRRAVAWAAINSNKMVTAITEQTRASLRVIVSDGIERGIGSTGMAREMRRMPTFSMNERQAKALINYRGMLTDRKAEIASALKDSGGNVAEAARAMKGKYGKSVVNAVKSGKFDVDAKVAKEARKKVKYRAEMIARTESARAVSEGTLEGYKEAGLQKTRFMAAMDACEICASLDGNIYTLVEAEGLVPQHPNCRCVLVPEDILATPEAERVADTAEVPEVVPEVVSEIEEAPLIPTAKTLEEAQRLSVSYGLADEAVFEGSVDKANMLNQTWASLKTRWNFQPLGRLQTRVDSNYEAWCVSMGRANVGITTQPQTVTLKHIQEYIRLNKNYPSEGSVERVRQWTAIKRSFKTGERTHGRLHSQYLWDMNDAGQTRAAITHEAGHALHQQNKGIIEKALGVDPENKTTWQRFIVTSRADDNFKETVAENFALIEGGAAKDVHPEMLKVLQQFMKR